MAIIINMKLAALLFVLLLSGCSHSLAINPDTFAGKLNDSFKTDIKSNGLKLFTYRVQLAHSNEAPLTPPPVARRVNKKTRGNTRAAGPDLSDWTEKVEHGLQQTLKMTGYCREGFIEISRTIYTNIGKIRGECKEGASVSERAQVTP